MSSTHLTAPTTSALARPRVLLAALATSAAVGVLTVISQGMVLAGGEEGARTAVEDELGASAAELPSLVDLAVTEAFDTLRTRAMLAIFLAAVVLALTAVAARGGRAARIALVIFLGITALVMLRSVTDVYPAGAQLPGILAVLLAPVAAVLLFLPAVGRYRTDRRQH